MSVSRSVVFLVDVDNTLLDGDRVQSDICEHVEREHGPEVRARYGEILERGVHEAGSRDYLEAMQRYQRDHPTDMRMLAISQYLLRYPFAHRLYPGALDVVARLQKWGQAVILSDGDVILQPRKIWQSGIHEAAGGHVLIYRHKAEALDDVLQRYPADHHVMVDDDPRTLDIVKKAWGDRVTTVLVRQGRLARDPQVLAACPGAADVTLDHISDLLQMDLADLPVERARTAARTGARRLPFASPPERILVIDIGGTSVKFLATGQTDPLRFPSGREMTPTQMVARIREMAADLPYDAVSMGYPGPVFDNRPMSEPHNLAPGWVGFDYEAAFGRPTRILNDAAMQALGGYRGGRMLFLGLGTGLGSALIVNGVLIPMELARLPYRDATYEDYSGIRAVERLGEDEWRECVSDIVTRLTVTLEPEDIVLGGGNVHRLKALPPRCRPGNNANAFLGGFRLWEERA